MDSDDEEMCDAASSAPSSPAAGGGVGEGEEEEGGVDDGRRGSEGVVIMEVTWFQVDLDYEFDAPRWFDLAQEEAPLDAAAAQEWFTSAPSYPPSRACSPLPRLAISSSSFVSSRVGRRFGVIRERVSSRASAIDYCVSNGVLQHSSSDMC